MTDQNGVAAPAQPVAGGAPASTTYVPVKPPVATYGQFYAPMALLGFAITFVPLFDDVHIEDGNGSITWTYDSLWAMAVASPYGGGAPQMGIFVIGILVLLLLVATFWPPRSFGLPLAITVWSVLPLLMLTMKFGTGDPAPALSQGGLLGLGLLVALMLVSAAHTIHLIRHR